MTKYNKKDYLNLLIIILSFLIFIIFLLLRDNSIYVSMLDYVSQHYAIPEYFRTLFYETKDIFPSFALNLGMGQNIFNFSYYGLFNPIILISYLLPFINMAYFTMISSILIVIVSIILFYRWISNHFENELIRFISTFMFMTSAPLILHSHRHIMFMNYIPFLLFGLLSVEEYVNNNKKNPLIISSILIILTSYFFSIPSLLVLFLYSIFLYLKKYGLNKNIINFVFKEILIFIIPILITAFFLMPTLKAILNSRFDSEGISLLSNFIPLFKFDNILYKSYSLGLTAILIPAIASAFITKEKHINFFGIGFILLTFFPIINYILNGFMYLNAKVFIPFIPFGIFLIANLLNQIIKKEINIKKLLIFTIIISLLGCLSYSKTNYYVTELLFVFIILGIVYKTKKEHLLLLLILPCIINCYFVNLDDNFSKKSILDNQYDKEVNEIMSYIDDDGFRIQDKTNRFYNANNVRNINEYKTTMYSSLTNKYFKNFFWNEFNVENPNRNHAIFENTNNILLNTYVGNKYLVSNNFEDIIGYEKIKVSPNYNLYKNDNVFSIGYANKLLMSKNEYEKLVFPYNVEALMNYIIVDKNVVSNYETNIKEIYVEQDSYKFDLKEVQEFNIETKNVYKDKLLIIRFDMNYSETCSVGDTYITINDISNKLTCRSWKYHNQNYTFEYVLSSNDEINNLNIKMSKGKFDISNIKVYELDYSYINNIKNNHSEFIIDKDKTKGDIIEGTINVLDKNSYFNISIPYDEGFTIYVDGKLQDYELVNTSFIGFPIEKGVHNIKIVYTSPWLKEGQIVSLVGIILFVVINLIDKKGVKKYENNINDSTML